MSAFKINKIPVLTILGYFFLAAGIIFLVMMVYHALAVSWKDIDRLFDAFKFLFFAFAGFSLSAVFFFFDYKKRQSKVADMLESQNQNIVNLIKTLEADK